MSTLTRSSMPRLNPAPVNGVAIARAEGPLRSSLPSRTEWLGNNGLRFLAKRAVDLAGASVGLLLLTPVMLAIAVLIRLDSPGPVLFRQWRRGYRGRPFRMLKFRTMVVDAEQRLGDLEESNEVRGRRAVQAARRPASHPAGTVLAALQPGRAAPVDQCAAGRDEPGRPATPPAPRQRSACGRWTRRDTLRRLQVLPGLTGPWQVGGRSELDYERMVQLDLDYVENGRWAGTSGSSARPSSWCCSTEVLTEARDSLVLAWKSAGGKAATKDESDVRKADA